MTRIDRTRYLDMEKYTLYGRIFLLFCSWFDVSQKEMARRMDLDAGAVSKHITTGKNEPERESVKRAIAAFRSVAAEKGITWNDGWDDLLLHGAGKATDEEMAASEKYLALLIAQQPPEG